MQCTKNTVVSRTVWVCAESNTGYVTVVLLGDQAASGIQAYV